jgi:ATP-dependent Lhr-like helicase
MQALTDTLADIRSKKIRVVTVDSEHPSPFAASLLFNWVASFLYDGDAPLAERRAQALAVDQAQLKDLIGDAELRDLLDADAIDAVERQLQRLDEPYRARGADGVHDMLLSLGDLTQDEIAARALTADAAGSLPSLAADQRVTLIHIAGEPRYVAAEDAARYRDALGIPLQPGLPETLLEPVADPIGDVARRYARTHGPFTAREFAARYALPIDRAHAVLSRLTGEHRLIEGEFRPGRADREWTDEGVLRMVRRRSLARVRQDVEPVEQSVLGRFATLWQGVASPRRGVDALLDVIEHLQGAALPASILESDILAARIADYDTSDLDTLIAAGEVVWVGVESIGERDGRVALYLADNLSRLQAPSAGRKPAAADIDRRESDLIDYLDEHGASFFAALHEAVGGGYPAETVNALWSLVWRGRITNDTLQPLRAFTQTSGSTKRRAKPIRKPVFRSRRLLPPSAEGRWSLVRHDASRSSAAATEWATAVAQQLLARHGVLTREAVAAEGIPGGFGLVYPVLRAMEDAGRIRRGYFVAGLGATQFAVPAAVDRLRSLRVPEAEGSIVALAASDPANPYGAALPWPAFAADAASARRGPTRTVGALVILMDGALVAHLARGDRSLLTWLPDAEPARSRAMRGIARGLIARARSASLDAAEETAEEPFDERPLRGMLIEEIDGMPPALHPLTPALLQAGFVAGALGLNATRAKAPDFQF